MNIPKYLENEKRILTFIECRSDLFGNEYMVYENSDGLEVSVDFDSVGKGFKAVRIEKIIEFDVV